MDNIITQKSETELCSFHLIFDVGSQCEGEKYLGISHLLEHLAFVGVEHMLDDMESEAVVYNAWTGQDAIVYTLTGLQNNVINFIYNYANGLVNADISEERFEYEKAIVLSEYSNDSDLESQFQKNLLRYISNDVIWCPIGKAENIMDITYDEFLEFKDKYYSKPSKIILTSKDYELDESRFDFDMTTQDELSEHIVLIDKLHQPEDFEVELFQDYTEQSSCSLAIISDNIITEDFPKINFINKMLGGSLTSSLYQIREKYGLCYSLNMMLYPLNYNQAINMFEVFCDYNDIQKVEDLFFEIMSNIKESITAEKVEKLKKKMTIQEQKIAIDLYQVPDYYCYPEWNDKSFLETITVEEIHDLIDKYYLDVEYIVLNDKELYQK